MKHIKAADTAEQKNIKGDKHHEKTIVFTALIAVLSLAGCGEINEITKTAPAAAAEKIYSVAVSEQTTTSAAGAAPEAEAAAAASVITTAAAETEEEAARGNDYGIFTMKFVLDGEKYLIADIA